MEQGGEEVSLHGANETVHVSASSRVNSQRPAQEERAVASAVLPDPWSPQTRDSPALSPPKSKSPRGLTWGQLEGGGAGQLRTQTACLLTESFVATADGRGQLHPLKGPRTPLTRVQPAAPPLQEAARGYGLRVGVRWLTAPPSTVRRDRAPGAPPACLHRGRGWWDGSDSVYQYLLTSSLPTLRSLSSKGLQSRKGNRRLSC